MALRTPSGRSGSILTALAPLLMAGGRVYCVDGGNQFNPYRLTELLRARRVDPMPVLERIFVSRAYTCHQLAGALETLLGPVAEAAAARAGSAEPGPLVVGIILGVETLFLDEDLPMFERDRLFDRVVAEARRLRGQGLPLLITYGAPAPGGAGTETIWARKLKPATRPLDDPRQWAHRLESFSKISPA